jgi:hypothetical protein
MIMWNFRVFVFVLLGEALGLDWIGIASVAALGSS